jgi:ATP-dependent Clp protease adapter protein ClpS
MPKGEGSGQAPGKKPARPSIYRVEIGIAGREVSEAQSWIRDVLKTIFRKSEGEIEAVLEQLRKNGVADCGRYPRDMAETKADEAKAELHRKSHYAIIRVEPLAMTSPR